MVWLRVLVYLVSTQKPLTYGEYRMLRLTHKELSKEVPSPFQSLSPPGQGAMSSTLCPPAPAVGGQSAGGVCG